MYGHETLSFSAVKRWCKLFVNGRIALEDNSRLGRAPRSDLCEFLRALIDETHFISCKRMCQKLWIPTTTCLPVLHEDLGFRKRCLRWISHLMTENEAQCRVTFFEELLQVMCHAKETNVKHLLTGDESWFYHEYPDGSAWAPSRTTLPARKTQKIQTTKCLVSIIWSTSGIHSLLAWPAGMRYDPEFFCVSVLPDIKRNLCDGRVGTRFEMSTSISIMHQLTTPNGRGKKLPESKLPGSCIRLILLMPRPVTSSCSTT
jgi:hypothetical protein